MRKLLKLLPEPLGMRSKEKRSRATNRRVHPGVSPLLKIDASGLNIGRTLRALDPARFETLRSKVTRCPPSDRIHRIPHIVLPTRITKSLVNINTLLTTQYSSNRPIHRPHLVTRHPMNLTTPILIDLLVSRQMSMMSKRTVQTG